MPKGLTKKEVEKSIEYFRNRARINRIRHGKEALIVADIYDLCADYLKVELSKKEESEKKAISV